MLELEHLFVVGVAVFFRSVCVNWIQIQVVTHFSLMSCLTEKNHDDDDSDDKMLCDGFVSHVSWHVSLQGNIFVGFRFI